MLGELPELPYLPELPARGPGADMIGRSAGLLVALPVELYAARWRVAARPGRDCPPHRRPARARPRPLTEQAEGYAGPFKLQAAGPWTLAANLDLPTGGPCCATPARCATWPPRSPRGCGRTSPRSSARLPGAALLLQLDEPSLPAVLAGQVPTESGFGTLPAVEETVAAETLREIVSAVGVPVILHCCAPDAPVELFRSAGAVGGGARPGPGHRPRPAGRGDRRRARGCSPVRCRPWRRVRRAWTTWPGGYGGCGASSGLRPRSFRNRWW